MVETKATVYETVKRLRNELHLSQEYVANYLGINRSTYTQMEKGNRKITVDDLSKLSVLYGVTADSILNGNELSQPAILFARTFEKLDENDQAEIINLMKFKHQMKGNQNIK